MSQKILIVGAGFAGVWGALGAARVLDGAGVTSGDVPQQDTAELLTGPYVARASLRYTVGSGAVVDAVGSAGTRR